jgi:hypothetical protein
VVRLSGSTPVRQLVCAIASALASLWLLSTPHPSSATADESAPTGTLSGEGVRQLLVTITCQVGSEPRSGSGIVVGAGPSRFYIVTANHVVRGAEEAHNIRVRFASAADQPVEGRLLADLDPDLDLAVLSVADAERLGITPDGLPFDRTADVNSLRRGDTVYAVGNLRPDGRSMSESRARISRRSGDWLYFESPSIAPGYAGGALLDEKRRLVGMLRAEQPPNGEAVSIATIASRLRDWGYPVSMGRERPVEIAGIWHGQASTDIDRKDVYFRGLPTKFAPEELWFSFTLDGDELHGTVTNHSGKWELFDGRMSGNHVSFTIRYDVSVRSGSDPPERVTIVDRFLGDVSGDGINFTLQGDSGYPPVEFTAKRVSRPHSP